MSDASKNPVKTGVFGLWDGENNTVGPIPLLRWRICFYKDGLKIYKRVTFHHIRYKTIPFVLIAFIISLTPGFIIYEANIEINPQFIIAIILATIGWFVTVTSARRLSRRQHTISVLREQSFNVAAQTFLLKFTSRFPKGVIISESDAKTLVAASRNKDHSWYDTYIALLYLLNHFEFIAVGIKHNDFDVAVLRDYYRSAVCAICIKTQEYIYCLQRSSKRLDIYENLIDLYKTWGPINNYPSSKEQESAQNSN